jgi:hypothetical protein
VRCCHTQTFLPMTTRTDEASTPTRGGDSFDTELAKDRRFGSLGLNLAFEGLLLGASLRLHVRATSSDPTSRGSGSITLSQVRKEDRSCFAGNEGHRRSMREDHAGG